MATARGRTDTPDSTKTPQTSGFSSLSEWENWFYSLTRDRGTAPTLEALKALEPQLAERGVSLVYNARGTSADLNIPGFGLYDVVGNMDNPDVGARTWTFNSTGENVGADGTIIARPRPPDSPDLGNAIPRDELFRSLSATSFAAAHDARRRQRARAGAGGRMSTILGGMPAAGSTGPSTRPASSILSGR